MIVVDAKEFNAWRQRSRALLIQRVAPDKVQWGCGQQGSLFDEHVLEDEPIHQSTAQAGDFSVPQKFMALAKQASYYHDSANPARKWAVLYSLLWRIIKVQRDTLSLQADPDVRYLHAMVKSVNRDMHKMKAFVRFQSEYGWDDVGEVQQTDHPIHYYTAWFEPEHDIVEAMTPFFVKRFTGMTWSILTPFRCAHWDQQKVKLSPGISRPHLPKDEFTAFWKTYYCHIFNPARLKEKAMMAEMPKKYWKYLPEAQCIKELTNGSSYKVDTMLANELSDPETVRQKSALVESYQNHLRRNNQT